MQIRILFTLMVLALISCGEKKKKSENSIVETVNSKAASDSGLYDLYIGTYTEKEDHVDGKGEGLYHGSFDLSTNNYVPLDTIRGFINPSYLHVSDKGDNVYVVNEIGPNDNETGNVWHFKRGEGGGLAYYSHLSTYGYSPCHVTSDSKNRILVVSNYMGGVMTAYSLFDNGSIHPSPQPFKYNVMSLHPRQEASHPHSAIFSEDDKKLYGCDLGGDRINSYVTNFETRKLRGSSNPIYKTELQDGPRHMDIKGDYLLVLHELSNQLECLKIDQSNSALTSVSRASTLPKDYSGSSLSADVHIHPNGKYVYTSNRGHNSIAKFTFDDEGKLDFVNTVSSGGDFPRNFVISPDGSKLLVANQNSDNVVVFDIDSKGDLIKAKEFSIPTPVCLKLAKKK